MLAGRIKSSVFEKFKWSLKEAFVYPRHFCVAGVVQAGDTKVSFQREERGRSIGLMPRTSKI